MHKFHRTVTREGDCFRWRLIVNKVLPGARNGLADKWINSVCCLPGNQSKTGRESLCSVSVCIAESCRSYKSRLTVWRVTAKRLMHSDFSHINGVHYCWKQAKSINLCVSEWITLSNAKFMYEVMYRFRLDINHWLPGKIHNIKIKTKSLNIQGFLYTMLFGCINLW